MDRLFSFNYDKFSNLGLKNKTVELREISVMLINIYLIVAFLIIFSTTLILLYLKLRNSKKESSLLQKRINDQSVTDNSLFCRVLAREYANELIRRDSAFYLNSFHRLFQEWEDLKSKDTEFKINTLGAIINDYEHYEDFSKIGYRNRAHIVNSDAFHHSSDEELWDIYRAIRLLLALSDDLGSYESSVHSHRYIKTGISIYREELDHLEIYLITLKEMELLESLKEAREAFDFLETLGADYNGNAPRSYSTEKFHISYVKEVPFGDRMGVYVRDIDLHGYWEDCTPKNVTFTDYYVSDDSQYLNGRKLSEFDLSDIEDSQNDVTIR